MTRRTSHQVNVATKIREDDMELVNMKYAVAFKEATEAWSKKRKTGIGDGIQKIVKDCNERNQCVNGSVSKTTVQRHKKAGKVQVSPELKRGPKSRMPPVLLDLTASHVNVGQLSEGFRSQDTVHDTQR